MAAGTVPYYATAVPRALTVVVLVAWIAAESLSGPARVSATDRRQDAGTRGFLFLAITVAFVAAALAAARVPGATLPGPADLPVFIGAVVALGGIAFRAWAIVTLGRFFTREVMIREGHTLVSNGPYRALRHPAYTGTLLAMTGLGLMFDNWVSLLISVAGFLVSHLPRILHEERVLEVNLGDNYRAFEKTHKRLIPGVW